MSKNQVTWPKDQRERAAKEGVGLFAIAVLTKEGSRMEFAGPSSPEIDKVMADAIAKVVEIDAAETKKKQVPK